MTILAIETSCDETAIAIVSEKDGVFEIQNQILASQAKIHAQYGGVVPEVAAREHASLIFPLLKELGVSPDGEGIDAIAVTAGPGLVPALRIGVEMAKSLAWLWNKPLVPVNHLEGHFYSVWLEQEQVPEFPALCLLVSGGHTELTLAKDHGEYELLGMTRDDAAGEAFDKVAKLLGLGYPGGPAIAKKALEGDKQAIDFPRPMLKSGDLDFSFAGLKTAVRVHLENNVESVEDVSASFLLAVTDVLVEKTMKAIEQTQPKALIISGGVSADRYLRTVMQQTLSERFPDVSFHIPQVKYTGDNASMIAVAGIMNAKKEKFIDPLELQANPNMRLA
jgi:N6-L-threonylcarbamoyladenine synthase